MGVQNKNDGEKKEIKKDMECWELCLLVFVVIYYGMTLIASILHRLKSKGRKFKYFSYFLLWMFSLTIGFGSALCVRCILFGPPGYEPCYASLDRFIFKMVGLIITAIVGFVIFLMMDDIQELEK